MAPVGVHISIPSFTLALALRPCVYKLVFIKGWRNMQTPTGAVQVNRPGAVVLYYRGIGRYGPTLRIKFLFFLLSPSPSPSTVEILKTYLGSSNGHDLFELNSIVY